MNHMKSIHHMLSSLAIVHHMPSNVLKHTIYVIEVYFISTRTTSCRVLLILKQLFPIWVYPVLSNLSVFPGSWAAIQDFRFCFPLIHCTIPGGEACILDLGAGYGWLVVLHGCGWMRIVPRRTAQQI